MCAAPWTASACCSSAQCSPAAKLAALAREKPDETSASPACSRLHGGKRQQALQSKDFVGNLVQMRVYFWPSSSPRFHYRSAITALPFSIRADRAGSALPAWSPHPFRWRNRSMPSTSASQLASMIFSETPMVPHVSPPWAETMRTRVLAAVAAWPSRMRTL